jgi:hypothetical protein
MEPEGLLPYSQEPAIGPYPEPGEFSPHPTASRSILTLHSHLRLGFPNGLFHSALPTTILYAFLTAHFHAKRPTLLSLLDLITLFQNVFFS